MPLIPSSGIAAGWSAGVTLATNEDWVCRKGAVAVTAEASPPADGGLYLGLGQGAEFAAGQTVRVRLAPWASESEVWREPRL